MPSLRVVGHSYWHKRCNKLATTSTHKLEVSIVFSKLRRLMLVGVETRVEDFDNRSKRF